MGFKNRPKIKDLKQIYNYKLLWRSWDSAAPGWWERIVEEKQIKKWRKVNDKDNLSRFKRACL